MTDKQRAHEHHSGHVHKVGAKEKFIMDLYPAALAESKQTGLSWQLILAQTAQETDWGQKVLPGTHNLYNIKAIGGWKGKSKKFKVREFSKKSKKWVSEDQSFRVYPSYKESLHDWITFLRDNPRYTAAGLFQKDAKGDLDKQAQALQKAGFATDPNYAKNIINVFNGPEMQRAIKEAQANMKSTGSTSLAQSSRATH